MLTDHLTNTIFLSDWLSKECPELYQSLTKTLRDDALDCRILSNTNDIWCRDYMPIQMDEKRFVSYKYYPNYLVEKHKEQYITDVKDVENVDFLHQAEVVTLDLVLDGGNVVKCGNKMVMTEKVFVENKEKSRNEVQRLLEEAFQCEIVFLPWDEPEIYGHSDGIIHYLGNNRVLMTNYNDFDKTFAQDFLRILEKHFDVKTLKYNVEKKNKNSWAYINYLQVGNLVLVPQLGIPEDEQAFQQITEAIPNSKVVGVPALEAVRNGGALNCISWNIKVQDYKQSVKWYKKAAEQGNSWAQNNLGLCYECGDGVRKNYKKAVELYGEAAEQGADIAQYHLAKCYENGLGILEDPVPYRQAQANPASF